MNKKPNTILKWSTVASLLWLVLPGGAAPAGTPVTSSKTKVDFNTDVRPFVSNTCFLCHGPDPAARKAKLRLDLRDEAIARGAIVPGKPEESEAYRRLIAAPDDGLMPPPESHKTLTPQQIETFRRWIAEGAEYRAHWSYVKPNRPALPEVKDKKWPRNPIDNFILARLEQAGIHPQPEADKYALIRRVTMDLTGLPATPAEADAFVADKAPDAYEKVVDRLLASSAYGEHWARQWLDLARYADSAGYADDPPRTIWAYRDYVIRSFNENKPFDRFTIEQIAGDLLPNPTEDQLMATAFHRNTMTNSEGGTDDEEFRTAAVVDRVNTTMSVWMGTSMACAQCHTHKYDPISQAEYFKMYAFFNNTEDADRKDEAPLLSFLTAEQKTQKTQWQSEVEMLEKKFATPPAAVVAAAEKWAREFPTTLDWQPLKPENMKAQSGAALTVQTGDTISAPGGAKQDIYTLEAPLTAAKITALRLETVPDAALPGGGAGYGGGNFVVTRVRATLLPPDNAPGPKARFIRIELPGTGKLLQLAEVQVFSGGENIAPRGEAKQSSTYAEAAAKRANDGNTAGEFAKNSVAHTVEGDTNPWWEVDLKAAIPIERIVVWNRAELPERLQGFRIVALDENRNTVWEKSGNAAPNLSVNFAVGGAREIALTTALTDFTQPEFDAADVLSDAPKDAKDDKRGWAVGGAQNQAHALSLLPQTLTEVAPGARLQIVIEQKSRFENHTLGRFRLAVTAAPRAAEALRTPPEIRAAMTDPAQRAKVAAYYARELAPELKAERQKLATLNKQIRGMTPSTVPIYRELAGDKRRKTRFQIRGNYPATGDEVGEGVPSAWHPLPPDVKPNRLALAQWLIDENNPLTARVVANRYWDSVFGVGLVRTGEEFGSQGEAPVNPELLDWLATELVRQRWDVKPFLKLLVTSAAYRQNSRVTPDLLEKDPDNRLVSRGPRFRLSAEMVRDQALFASGLLSPKMFGPPVRPLRPNMGLNAAFGGGLDWQTSAGEDRYRRALYTEWRRTSPYPSMVTFDAPNREICTLRRERTNTPLQALVTLNDPVYVEAAQALARRVIGQGGSVEDKVRYAFRLCLTRPPQASEVKRLTQLYADSLAHYQVNSQKATEIATDPHGPPPMGTDLSALAAWTTLANVLLNLDETLMKR